MTSNVVLPAKTAGETLRVTFPFLSQLHSGEGILTADVVAEVYSGEDLTPQAIVSGPADILGTNVTQDISGGEEGTVYSLTCTVTTDEGQTLAMSGLLTIVPAVI